MDNSTENTDRTAGFHERYLSYTYIQIKEILENHKDYQEPAVTAAVQIAIERRLINSEQDLFAPEFQSATPHGVKIFPVITNSYYYKKTVASIFRVLFIVGIMPLIFGLMKYAEGKITMTITALIVGSVWLLLTFFLLRTKRIQIIFLQLILLVLTISSIAYSLIVQEVFHRVDMAILIIGFFISLYLLLYLKKLIQTKPDDL